MTCGRRNLVIDKIMWMGGGYQSGGCSKGSTWQRLIRGGFGCSHVRHFHFKHESDSVKESVRIRGGGLLGQGALQASHLEAFSLLSRDTMVRNDWPIVAVGGCKCDRVPGRPGGSRLT
eukprot:894221-Amorphochlora_amoeboformis.AAC.2